MMVMSSRTESAPAQTSTNQPGKPRQRRLGSVVARFVALSLAWGASFLFIKVGLTGFSPPQVVFGRLAAGAAALWIVTVVSRQRLPHRPAVWAHLGVVSVLLCVVPFLLFAWAEQHVPSGLASIYNATTPLMTMLVALLALPAERPTRAKLGGLLLGFAGVVMVLGPWHALAGGDGAAQAACLGATLSYGMAFVYLRRFVTPLGLPAVSVATVQVSLGAAIMLVLSPSYIAVPVSWSWAAVASIAVLGAFGTGLAYVWNTGIVAAWGATNASTVTYLTPVVGVVAGVAVLGEQVTWNEPIGALIVIAAIALVQGRLHRRATPNGSHR
jgi:drug/metabolite transporter (DMT)-like permease